MRDKEEILLIFVPYNIWIDCGAVKQKSDLWRRRVWCVILRQ